MSAGPLRRITAVAGLVAVAPVAVLVLISALTPEEAAIRAVLVVSAVVLLGNLARVVLTQLLHVVERELPSEDDLGVGTDRGGARSVPSAPLCRAEDRLQVAQGP